MLGRTIDVSQPTVRLVPLADVPYLLGGPESEAVGIYLRAHGEIPGQLMLVLAYPQALELADLVLMEPPGTTQSFGKMERSALAELGNLIGSCFLCAMSNASGFDARPTPPAVMVDMIGAILDIVVATYDGVSQYVLLLQVSFLKEDREGQADFWIIPDLAALKAFAQKKLQPET